MPARLKKQLEEMKKRLGEMADPSHPCWNALAPAALCRCSLRSENRERKIV